MLGFRSAAFGLTALWLAGCVTTSIDVTFAPGAIAVKGDGATYLHAPSEAPIHIGDGKGDSEEIPREFRLASPPRGYAWKFRRDRVPASAEMEVTMQNLDAAGDAAHCNTYAILNGTIVAGLNSGAGAGPVGRSVATFPLKPDAFRVGENVLQIAGEPCRSAPAGDRLDDSLIRSVLIRVT